MGTFANLRYNPEAFTDLLVQLRNNKAQLQQLGDSIVNIVTKKLLEHGITGKTADVLLTNFKIQVVSYIEDYVKAMDLFIEANEHVQETNDEKSRKVSAISNSI